MFDLPQPFGPTTPHKLVERDRCLINERFETGELDGCRRIRGYYFKASSAKQKPVNVEVLGTSRYTHHRSKNDSPSMTELTFATGLC